MSGETLITLAYQSVLSRPSRFDGRGEFGDRAASGLKLIKSHEHDYLITLNKF